jgi:hypothetical protein
VRTTPNPIPPRLWSRLAALDARCDLLLERRSVARDRCGQGTAWFIREWRVTIGERDRATGRGPVICIAASLAQALEGAVKMAEQYRWHLPIDAASASA